MVFPDSLIKKLTSMLVRLIKRVRFSFKLRALLNDAQFPVSQKI